MKDIVEDKELNNKVEKLVTALYLVTAIMPKSEPLRVSLRQEALKLLSPTFNIKDTMHAGHQSHFSSVIDSCMSLTNIAAVSSTISDMNAKWLLKGFAVVKDIYMRHTAESIDLNNYEIKDIAFNLNKGLSPLIPLPRVLSPTLSEGEGATPPLTGEIGRGISRQKPNFNKRSELSSTDRQDQIYALLTDGNTRLLPEISKYFSGITDKTVQRDLQALMDAGKVRKIGERRWSKYTIM